MMKSPIDQGLLLSLKSTLLVTIAIVAAGCSHSNDDSQVAPPTYNDNPFNSPDVNGTTTIARLGYPAARDSADDIVSMSYLREYYQLDKTIANLLEIGGTDNVIAIDCPGGGTANGNVEIYNFSVIFNSCLINDRTLTGGLSREVDFSVFGLGSSQDVTVSFDNLTIETGESTRVTLTGVSTRNDHSVAIMECNGQPLIRHNVTNQIDSAQVEQDVEETLITDAHWQQSVVTEPKIPIEDPTAECLTVEHLIFAGTALANSEIFDDKLASIQKLGDITRGGTITLDSSADLSANFGDNSSFVLTLSSDSESLVQVDILNEDAVVSFVDSYRFEAREDIPPILGE